MKPQKPLLLFFRKFLPLSRRALLLLFQWKTTPSFELFHAKKASGKLIDTTVHLKVENGLILQVNGHLLPIYSDDHMITLKVPNSSSKLVIRLRGLFGSIYREVDVQRSVVQLPSCNATLNGLDSIGKTLSRNPKIREREVKILLQDARLKSFSLTLNSKFSLQGINNSLKIKKTEPSLTNQLSIMDVSHEVETILTINQIDYEK